MPDQDRHIEPERQTIGFSGLSGLQQRMSIMRNYTDPNDERNSGGEDGLPGRYKVVFTLGRPGFSLHDEYLIVASDYLDGDSHLAIAKPAIEGTGPIVVSTETDSGVFEFTGLPNRRGFLGKLVLESIDAENREDAERRAYSALASVLSSFSVHLDLPMHIFQTDVIELRTGNIHISTTTAYPQFSYEFLRPATINVDFRFYASFYREALNSNTPVYQFICLFKIIEGIQTRQNRLAAEARGNGTVFSRPREIVPADVQEQMVWLNELFTNRQRWDAEALSYIFPQEAVGRRIRDVVDNLLRPVRVGVAHALSADSGEPMMYADNAINIGRVVYWLPLTRIIARRLMRMEFPDEFTP